MAGKSKPPEIQVAHFEAVPKSVKRALKVLPGAISVVEVRASDPAAGEHGKTTVAYTFAGNDGEHRLALDALGKQVNIEQDHLLRDDPDDEEDA